jgi:hypothetical protein
VRNKIEANRYGVQMKREQRDAVQDKLKRVMRSIENTMAKVKQDSRDVPAQP